MPHRVAPVAAGRISPNRFVAAVVLAAVLVVLALV